jgi:Na+/melibiose symporter-like transporter
VYGVANFAGAGIGAAGAALSAWLLEAYAFPASFVWIFVAAAASLTLSWAILAHVREPLEPATAPPRSNLQFLAGLPEFLDNDRNFRQFLVARALMALGTLGLGFLTVASIQRWEVGDGAVGLYTAAYWLGQSVGYPAFGFLSDRFGHKLVLEAGTLSAALAFALAWLAPGPQWMYLVFFLMGISIATVMGSGILIALEFSTLERRPTYVGLTNSVVGAANLIAPLLGAWLANVGYGWLFAASAGFNLLAVVLFRGTVREPRQVAGATP